jgi:hypothetical protein
MASVRGGEAEAEEAEAASQATPPSVKDLVVFSPEWWAHARELDAAARARWAKRDQEERAARAQEAAERVAKKKFASAHAVTLTLHFPILASCVFMHI